MAYYKKKTQNMFGWDIKQINKKNNGKNEFVICYIY